MKKKFAYISIVVVLALQIFGNAGSVQAAGALDSKIADTKETVQKLLQVKDNTTISATEKARLELELKKTILLSILDISLDQLQEARKQIDKIAFPESDDWKEVRSYLFGSLDAYEGYYKQAQNDVRNDKDLTLDEIKDTAAKIETKKSSDIDPFIKKANNVASIFNIGNILKLADERLTKVGDDVQKVYGQKLTTKSSLKDMYTQAGKLVEGAHLKNNAAREIVLHLYIPSAETATNTDTEFMSKLNKDVLAFLKATQGTSATPAASPAPLKSPQPTVVTNANIEEYLEQLIKDSAENIREAYDTFLKMSVSVKEYMKE